MRTNKFASNAYLRTNMNFSTFEQNYLIKHQNKNQLMHLNTEAL